MKKQKERIIHLDDMLLYILRQWKIFIIGIIIIGAVSGCIGMSKINKKYMNIADANQKTVEKVNVTGADLINVDTILYLEQAIADQKEYIDNSFIMKIDPYEKRIASVKYQFCVSEDIAPEVCTGRMEQGEKAYQNVFGSAEIYAYIKKSLSLETDKNYIKELVSFETESVGVLVVDVIAPDEELAQGIRDAIKDYLHENHTEILKNYKELAVKIDSEYIVTVIDTGLQNIQTAQYNNLQNLQSMLEARNLALSDTARQYLALAKKEFKEGRYESGQTLYKKIAASAEVGLRRKMYEAGGYTLKRVLLLICVLVVWYGLKYMWSSKLMYAYDLWEMYDVRVIDVLPGNAQEMIKVIAEKIAACVTEDSNNVLLISSDMEKTDISVPESLKEALKKEGLSVEYLSTMDETGVFNRIKNSENIIMVENIGKSRYSRIEKCVDNVYCLGREIIGALIIR